ncbi:MAG: glutaminyl-peptide cyclotransferase, partial [Opitutaceae bacterium]
MKNANPVSQGRGFLLAAALALAACGRNAPERAPSVPPSPPLAAGAEAKTAGAPVPYTFDVVTAWPHDRGAFTQGLVVRNGGFLESTGLNGQSTLREVDLKTGRVLKQVAIAAQYFGEGLAVIGDRAFVLTWQHGKGFVYDADTFRLEREFAYTGEGWGLTTDGTSLILSDGTARLRFLDPTTFAVTRTVEVTSEGKPVEHLNELEFIRGEVFANIWMENEILRIDPATGAVRGVIDCSGLLPRAEIRPDTDVLNGIAYDPATDRLFLTGKRWPKIY